MSYFISPFAESLGKITNISTKGMSFLTILLLLLSVSLAVAMIKLYQLIFFLMFINIEIPNNAARLIQSFKTSPIDYAPSINTIFSGGGSSSSRRILSEELTMDHSFVCLAHKKFQENGQGCNSFENIGGHITQFFAFLAIRGFLDLIFFSLNLCSMKESKKIIELKSRSQDHNESSLHLNKSKVKTEKNIKKGSYLIRTVRSFRDFFGIAYFLQYLKASQLKSVLGVMISFSAIPQKSQASIAWEDTATSIIILIVYGGLVILLTVVVIQRRNARKRHLLHTLRDHEAIIKSLKLEEEFSFDKKTKKGCQELTLLSSFISDLLIPMILVLAINAPLVQIILVLLIKVKNFVIVISYTPYKLRSRNFLEIFNTGFYVVILVVFLIMKLGGKEMTKNQNLRFLE